LQCPVNKDIHRLNSNSLFLVVIILPNIVDGKYIMSEIHQLQKRDWQLFCLNVCILTHSRPPACLYSIFIIWNLLCSQLGVSFMCLIVLKPTMLLQYCGSGFGLLLSNHPGRSWRHGEIRTIRSLWRLLAAGRGRERSGRGVGTAVGTLGAARRGVGTRGGARGNPSRFGGLMVLLVAGLSMIRSCYSRRSAIAFAGRVQFVRISLMWSFEGFVVCPSLFHVTFISIEAMGCRIN
jgi:hypothetical protein